MKLKNKSRASLLLFWLFIAMPLSADVIQFKADSMSGNTGSGQETTILSGRAWISTSEMEINADRIELSGANYDIITASGSISGVNTESGFTFTAAKLSYDRRTDIVKLEGNVTLTDTENDVTASAYLIEYNQKTETAVLQMNVKLVQKDSVCTAALATWRKDERMLEMSGTPKIVRKDDTFTAQEITFNMDTEEITLDGKVRGTVTDTSETSEEANTSDSSEAAE